MGSFKVMQEKPLQLCFLLFHSVRSFGEILTEAVVLRAFLLHALKSSLLPGAEAGAAGPWTAPLLQACGCLGEQEGLGGIFPERLH